MGFVTRSCPTMGQKRVTNPLERLRRRLVQFQIKTYYLSDANYPTDNSSQTDDPSLV